MFRVVCSNGAIWVHSGAAFSLETGASTSDWEIEEFVRSSTETAASDEAFQGCLAEIRSGIAAPMRSASLVSTLLAARIPELASHLLEVALEETKVDSEIETRYDAMNAVTAAARQVRDPETKWKMEAYATTLLLGAAVDEPARPSWAAALVA